MSVFKEEGTICEILAEETGESKAGKSWSKQTFAIEVPHEKMAKYFAFTLWGDKITDLSGFSVGDKVEVIFNIDSRAFNGKWYTNMTAQKIIGTASETKNTTKKKEKTPEPKNDMDYDIDDLPF